MIVEDGALKKIDAEDYVNGTVVIPENVTKIDEDAFYSSKE